MHVHPRAFDFVRVRTFQPEKSGGPPEFRLQSLPWIVEVVVHSPPQIGCQADIENNASNGCKDIATRFFRNEPLPASAKSVAIQWPRYQVGDVHISMAEAMDVL